MTDALDPSSQYWQLSCVAHYGRVEMLNVVWVLGATLMRANEPSRPEGVAPTPFSYDVTLDTSRSK